MVTTQTLRRHATLFSDLLESVGLDLEENVQRGDLAIDEIGDAVLACTGCARADACEALLAEVNRLEAPPDYCRNRLVIESLLGRS